MFVLGLAPGTEEDAHGGFPGDDGGELSVEADLAERRVSGERSTTGGSMRAGNERGQAINKTSSLTTTTSVRPARRRKKE